MTQGDTITVKTDLPQNPEFKFDIVEIKPVSPYKTVSIINCDLNLDFEAPLDYVEPTQPTLEKRSSSVIMEEGRTEVYLEHNKNKEFSEFTGKHFRIDNKSLKEDVSKKREEYDPRKHRLQNGVRKNLASDPFAGKGIRIK